MKLSRYPIGRSGDYVTVDWDPRYRKWFVEYSHARGGAETVAVTDSLAEAEAIAREYHAGRPRDVMKALSWGRGA